MNPKTFAILTMSEFLCLPKKSITAGIISTFARSENGKSNNPKPNGPPPFIRISTVIGTKQKMFDNNVNADNILLKTDFLWNSLLIIALE